MSRAKRADRKHDHFGLTHSPTRWLMDRADSKLVADRVWAKVLARHTRPSKARLVWPG
jgi:hypothetical protein